MITPEIPTNDFWLWSIEPNKDESISICLIPTDTNDTEPRIKDSRNNSFIPWSEYQLIYADYCSSDITHIIDVLSEATSLFGLQRYDIIGVQGKTEILSNSLYIRDNPEAGLWIRLSLK